jgi:DNA-3-methyladenine glycosylase II
MYFESSWPKIIPVENLFFIPVPDEFDFKLCLSFLNRSPREVMHVCDGDYVIKLIRAGDKRILFRMSQTKEGRLEVEVLNSSCTPGIITILEAYVREWFDLDTDIRPFYSLASRDRLLKALVERYRGYRIVGHPDLFESLSWAVIGQQINLGFAYTLKQRFVEQFGERLQVNGTVHHLFPNPVAVAKLRPEDLYPLQFSRQKSNYTIGIAEAFASGELSKEKLKAMPLQEAKDTLMRIKGIGNWTANYALMKTFHFPDAFPLEDAGLHNALKNKLKLDRKPTLAEVAKVFKKYKGWEAYATLYLWKSLGFAPQRRGERRGPQR